MFDSTRSNHREIVMQSFRRGKLLRRIIGRHTPPSQPQQNERSLHLLLVSSGSSTARSINTIIKSPSSCFMKCSGSDLSCSCLAIVQISRVYFTCLFPVGVRGSSSAHNAKAGSAAQEQSSTRRLRCMYHHAGRQQPARRAQRPQVP